MGCLDRALGFIWMFGRLSVNMYVNVYVFEMKLWIPVSCKGGLFLKKYFLFLICKCACLLGLCVSKICVVPRGISVAPCGHFKTQLYICDDALHWKPDTWLCRGTCVEISWAYLYKLCKKVRSSIVFKELVLCCVLQFIFLWRNKNEQHWSACNSQQVKHF